MGEDVHFFLGGGRFEIGMHFDNLYTKLVEFEMILDDSILCQLICLF